jgi:hypothetical protein
MTGDLIEDSEGARKRDLTFFLQKPFRISEVLALLRDALAAAPAETRQS